LEVVSFFFNCLLLAYYINIKQIIGWHKYENINLFKNLY
jgi:hypothetical protein